MTVTDYIILRKMHRPVHNGDDFSRLHPKMKRGNRAKIFAPFDALSGFDETMDVETVFTVHPAESCIQHLITRAGAISRMKFSGIRTSCSVT